MNFQVTPAETPRRLWPFLLIGAGVVVLLLGLLTWFGRQPARHAPVEARLPFGATEQAYAAKVKFENLKLSRFANLLHQVVTYLSGDVVNQGNRTIADLQVRVEFRNARNQVVLRETVTALGSPPSAVAPGGRRSFQLGFEDVPDDWNVQVPGVRVTGLVLH